MPKIVASACVEVAQEQLPGSRLHPVGPTMGASDKRGRVADGGESSVGDVYEQGLLDVRATLELMGRASFVFEFGSRLKSFQPFRLIAGIGGGKWRLTDHFDSFSLRHFAGLCERGIEAKQVERLGRISTDPVHWLSSGPAPLSGRQRVAAGPPARAASRLALRAS